MAIKLKITNEKGETREVVVEAGETLELQAGEKVELAAASTENLDLTMDGGDLVLSLNGVQITVGNFAGSGGLVSGGQTITAQQVASGLFASGEEAGQEEAEIEFEAENTETFDSPSSQPALNLPASPEQTEPELFSTLPDSDPLDSTFADTQTANINNNNADNEQEDGPDASNEAEDSPSNTPDDILPLELNVGALPNATEENLFSFTIPEATGGLGNTIYSVSLSNGQPLPDWLSFDPSTRTLSGTPDDGDLESLSLQITASDATGLLSPATDTVTLNISGINDAPELSLDDNGDPQSISVTDTDAGATITKATITLRNGEAGDELSVNLDGTSLTSEYVNGVLTITGSATADVYQSVLQSLSHSTKGEFTIGGERTLDIVVTDDQGANSNSVAASVTVGAKDWSFNEDDLVDDAGNQIIGHWKPAGSSDSASMTKVVMNFGGKDYIGDEVINEAGNFKITIEDTDRTPPIPVMGIIYFRTDGTIELEPTEAIDFMPEGMDLSASFTYTVIDGESSTDHTFGMKVSGQNDAPELTLDDSGDPKTIEVTDADANATITKATITLKNGEAGDELSVNLDGTSLTSEYVNGVLTITGSATTDVYQSVLQSLSHSTKGEFTIGGERTLDIVVTDDQGANSNSVAASVTVGAKDWSFNEDDLVDDAGNQIIGHWKPAGSSDSASMTKVVMNFGGKDYIGDEVINEAGDFKITIEDTDGTPPIPEMGIIYFRADGTIELVPTKAIDFMPEGMDLSASFTYTIEDGGSGSTTTHTFDMKVTGQNDAPEIDFIASDSHDNASGLFGNVEITDPDMGDKINGATVTLKDGSLKDAINIDVEAILKDFGITVTNSSLHVLTFSGEASKEDYEAALSRVYFLSEELTSNRQLTLDIAVTDKLGATGNAETTIDLNASTSQEFLEDDLLEDAESNEGSVLTERWKPEGTDSKITSVVMTYNGKDYVRDIGDFTNGNYFKITIEDQEGAGGLPFDPIGEVFFHADGRVEFRPAENLNMLPEGYALAARFTYTTELNGVSEVHGMDIKLIGNNDSPHITFEPSSGHDNASGLFGNVEITDPDMGDKINGATVTLKDGSLKDAINIDVQAILKDFGITVTNSSAHELTFSGEASKEDYEAALSRVYFLSEELASNRQLTLDIAVTDKAGATGKAETTINLNAPTSQEFLEDDLLEDAESNEGSVLTERWKPEGTDSKITSVVMTYSGKDYVRDIGDFTNGNYFKITIEDQEGAGGLPFDPIGEVFFHADGRVEFRPAENLNMLPEGYALAARFTYTTELNGVSEVHGMDIKLIGNNDSPHITFEPSSGHDNASGLFGNIEITDPDMGDKINSATVTLKDGGLDDVINIDVQAILKDFGITVTNSSAHELTFSGEASKEDYEAALSRVYFLSEELASNRQLTLDIAVTDKAGATGKAETTINLNAPTSQEFLEDDLLEDAESNEGSVLTERWKPEGTDSKITSVVMTYSGKDYVRDIGDFTNGNYFKITIEDQEGAGGLPFDPIGEVFFHADGRVEFRPAENLNMLPEGYALAARFTYTTELNGVSEVHGMDIKLIGNNDSPHITFEPSSGHDNASGLFGNIEITDPDMGDKINSATVTLKDGGLDDVINIDVQAILKDFGITVTNSSAHELTFSGEASKEDYEAALSRVYFLSEELASNRQLTLDIAVTDKAGATGKAETTITVNKESTINISESGLFSGADNQQSWKPEGMDGGKVTSVIMNFDGKDYIRDISDYSDKSDHFKITIEDESKGIPKLGALYFKPDGTIEFEPYPVEFSQAFGTNEGQLPGLEATFTYTVEDNNGDTSVHVLDMVLSGDDVITARFSEPAADYDVLNIEASNGETALLEFFSKDSETVEGIEEVSLSNAKLSFNLEDVIDITSDDNVLYISDQGQGQLEEGFDSNMTNKGTVDHNDKTWQHYSYTMNNAEVNLYVEQSLTNLPENV